MTENILEAAHKKAVFENSDLIIRLKSFPIQLLNGLILADEEFLKNFSMDSQQIIEEIKDKKDHLNPKLYFFDYIAINLIKKSV